MRDFLKSLRDWWQDRPIQTWEVLTEEGIFVYPSLRTAQEGSWFWTEEEEKPKIRRGKRMRPSEIENLPEY